MGSNAVLISTGEASGDSIGAELLKEMRSLGFSGEAFAIGSANLRLAGAKIIADSSEWGAIGIYESLRVALTVFRQYARVKRWLRQARPDLFIAVDFGFMNVRLCRYAKALGVKVLYFMPPGSWRRNAQGVDLPKVTDKIAAPFEWTAAILNQMGGNAEWVGHPIVQMAARFHDCERDSIALFPGSRRHEVVHNLPVMAKAANLLSSLPYKWRLVLAPTVGEHYVGRIWRANTHAEVELTPGPALAALKRARAAIVCSGTATLEAAICMVPMVVIYRFGRLMHLEALVRRPTFDFVALPSIILGRRAVPELLQTHADPGRIATELIPLVGDTTARAAQLAAFQELTETLGPTDALTRAAKMALSLLKHRASIPPAGAR